LLKLAYIEATSQYTLMAPFASVSVFNSVS
jgi:hypothetical protein